MTLLDEDRSFEETVIVLIDELLLIAKVPKDRGSSTTNSALTEQHSSSPKLNVIIPNKVFIFTFIFAFTKNKIQGVLSTHPILFDQINIQLKRCNHLNRAHPNTWL
jgi:hypothetical protein